MAPPGTVAAGSRANGRASAIQSVSPGAMTVRFVRITSLSHKMGTAFRSLALGVEASRSRESAAVRTSRPLQLICKDKGSVIRSRGDASDGDDHGCEGDFGKEVCCAAERRGTRAEI